MPQGLCARTADLLVATHTANVDVVFDGFPGVSEVGADRGEQAAAARTADALIGRNAYDVVGT
jgi:hypothetical protein